MTGARVHAKPATRHPWLVALGWASLFGLVTTLSAFVHLGTRVGRAAATDLAELLMNSRIRGTSRIGAITRLDFDGVEMVDLTVTSPAGEQVISADRLTAELAFVESLRRGAVVLTPCELEGGTMRVTRGPRDQISLVSTLEVPDDRFMIPVELRDIHLLHQTMVFHLPPVPISVEMANVYGLVDMHLGHEFTARMDQVHGYVSFPVVHIGFRGLNGRLRSDDAQPLVVRMLLDLEVSDPSMAIHYAAPGAVDREGGGSMSIELGVDVPDGSGIATRRGLETEP
jgi:hypothetical protein